jgi:hypothetical protein
MAKLAESVSIAGGVSGASPLFPRLRRLRSPGRRFAGRDLTDIDLWVYTRASVHARHIAIVDIKNKRKSKAYERLIWLKGLQFAVRADEAIVATAASRDDLKPFAARMGIKLLSDQVFKAVVARFADQESRFNSES